MTLYRCTFQALPGRPCRHMTYAARDQQAAIDISRDWTIGRCLPLVIKPLREIARPFFSLT